MRLFASLVAIAAAAHAETTLWDLAAGATATAARISGCDADVATSAIVRAVRTAADAFKEQRASSDVDQSAYASVELPGKDGATVRFYKGDDAGTVASEHCQGDTACVAELMEAHAVAKKGVGARAEKAAKRAIASCERRGYGEDRLPHSGQLSAVASVAAGCEAFEAMAFADEIGAALEKALWPSFRKLGGLAAADKVEHHRFDTAYERFIGGSATREGEMKMLELGLSRGPSMELWCGYLPRTTIHGIDANLREDCLPCALGRGVQGWAVDPSDPASLAKVAAAGGPFDIVVDDASHGPAAQLEALKALFASDAALAPGGLYIIEDIETSYWTSGEVGGNPVKAGRGSAGSAVAVLEKLADVVNAEFFDPAHTVAELGAEVSAAVESVAFERNMVALRKRGSAGEAATLDRRNYRYSDNVGGYKEACALPDGTVGPCKAGGGEPLPTK